MGQPKERSERSYTKHAFFLLLIPIVAIAIIALTFWITEKKEHVDVVAVIATLIMASVGIMAAVLSLDLNAKTLRQNERMIRLTELANRPFFDRDTFVCSGTLERILFSVTNIGGKPAYITKITMRIRGKQSLDWEFVPPEEHRTVESGSVFFSTVELSDIPGSYVRDRYDPDDDNTEVVVIKIDYKNYEHKEIEMKDLTVSHAYSRDLNRFLRPAGGK